MSKVDLGLPKTLSSFPHNRHASGDRPRRLREAIAEVIDFLIMALDETEDDADLEPSLGSVERSVLGQQGWADGSGEDREADIADMPHDSDGIEN